MIESHAPFYHPSVNTAQYEYDPFPNEMVLRPSNDNYENHVNHSGSTLDDSNLKDGESVLDGSDSYSGSDKSRDAYHRNKVCHLNALTLHFFAILEI